MANPITKTLSPNAANMIRMDHTHVLTTFHRYKPDSDPKTKQGLVNTACLALEIHAQLEEEIFYPAMDRFSEDRPVVDKSIPEHQEMRELIDKLRGMEPTDSDYDDTFMALMRDVMHHVADEETVLLPDAERLLGPDRLDELGAEMMERRLQLTAPRTGELALNMARAWPASSMIMAAGAVLAGTYFAKRAFDRHA
ncbi:MAG: hemerythrin domain-containing protein [Burkholderiaceae bacterium]